MTSRYHEIYRHWQDDPQGFWAEASKQIDWVRALQRIFDPNAGRWFPDATCNTCWNAVDRHVASGRSEQIAVLYDSPVAATQRAISYRELLRQVRHLAAVLQDLGVAKGDRVLIYMPMIPEAVFAMLACARLGAVHSVVFGGFAANELATRIDDAQPKLICRLPAASRLAGWWLISRFSTGR
jgi:propionyl-CoA synthetase